MKLKYIITLVLALYIFACETVDFGDTNANNNGPSTPYPAGMLAGAIMTFATQTGRVGLMQPTLYVQYQSQVTYTDEMQYAEVPTDWGVYYRDCLIDLQGVINFVSDPVNLTPTVLAQGAAENQAGVAMIFKAIVMKQITNTWGDAPYSSALQGGTNLSPPYDKQEDILKQLITELKQGRDMLDNTKNLPTGDIIYNGDVDKWKKLANSVIMQITISMSKKYPASGGYAAIEFNAALANAAGIIDEITEEAWFKYKDIAGFRNPWNANRTPDYFLSREFTDALNGNATVYNRTSNSTFDSRLKVYADDFTKPGVPYGYILGSGAGASSVSNVNYWNNTTPLPLMTASYVYLNRAHARQLGWTAESVSTLLANGIVKSFETLDAHFGTSVSSDAAGYAAARVADANGAFGYTQVIAEEKWVSLFGQAFDAWTEWRVSGHPNLLPATDYINNGQIPRRYLYPSEEATLNKSKYDQGVATLVPAEDKNTSKVWFDQ